MDISNKVFITHFLLCTVFFINLLCEAFIMKYIINITFYFFIILGHETQVEGHITLAHYFDLYCNFDTMRYKREWSFFIEKHIKMVMVWFLGGFVPNKDIWYLSL